jgi:hypothetical protein
MSEPEDEASRGWDSDFVRFSGTPSNAIVAKLRQFLADASREQLHAWDDSIPRLQEEVDEVREAREGAARYTAILEYRLPMESRRADAIFLLRESVVVIELKGKSRPSDADIDQAHAYARDLRCYHAECDGRSVTALLIPTHARGDLGNFRGVRVCGPDALDRVIDELDIRGEARVSIRYVSCRRMPIGHCRRSLRPRASCFSKGRFGEFVGRLRPPTRLPMPSPRSYTKPHAREPAVLSC